MITKEDLILKMGEALGNQDGDGRYPDIEQDAMRYWVNRHFIASLAEITPERLDEMSDKFIKKILEA